MSGRIGSVVAALAVFLVGWKGLVVVGGYPPFILPPPEAVAVRFVEAWTGGLIIPHVATTLLEIALGFGAGAGLALVVGYLLARSAVVERASR